ncbi:unnamed protein product [Heligmosomoides polygyrus]|uniref:Foie-gras_1 domain-containing protein n=1 Tax=Heligmosomoides polygyrus TaxID=6339 RepID=A0A183FC71_HELPZ|nr:unnamed protein product [Heligmosomoides polygyrus]
MACQLFNVIAKPYAFVVQDEAEAIYVSEDRYDMVNKIHQAQNAWNQARKERNAMFSAHHCHKAQFQAFEVASRHDRIHLRNTHYNYAKYLERAGALEPAIDKYVNAAVYSINTIICLFAASKSQALTTLKCRGCLRTARKF